MPSKDIADCHTGNLGTQATGSSDAQHKRLLACSSLHKCLCNILCIPMTSIGQQLNVENSLATAFAVHPDLEICKHFQTTCFPCDLRDHNPSNEGSSIDKNQKIDEKCRCNP